ncbi:hypothetical protein ACFLRF_02375 [Candidatus Altiarchaeota archaeon]
MTYESLRKGLGREKDAVSVMSVITTELQLKIAFLILAFLAIRLCWHPLPAAVATLCLAMVLYGRNISFAAFYESSDDYDKLLFYFITVLTAIILLVGWRP